MERYRIPIEGMTCTSCVARITRSVRKVGGVTSVRVDLASDSATVTFEPDHASLGVVVAAIERSGYLARVEGAEPATDSRVGEPRRAFLSRFLPSR